MTPEPAMGFLDFLMLFIVLLWVGGLLESVWVKARNSRRMRR